MMEQLQFLNLSKIHGSWNQHIVFQIESIHSYFLILLKMLLFSNHTRFCCFDWFEISNNRFQIFMFITKRIIFPENSSKLFYLFSHSKVSNFFFQNQPMIS
jgi:hypothetical protein